MDRDGLFSGSNESAESYGTSAGTSSSTLSELGTTDDAAGCVDKHQPGNSILIQPF